MDKQLNKEITIKHGIIFHEIPHDVYTHMAVVDFGDHTGAVYLSIEDDSADFSDVEYAFGSSPV